MARQKSIFKQIVCLANSRMMGNRCIAGKEFQGGSWIRPVNEYREGLPLQEYQYEDGSDLKILDIIDIPLLKSFPQGHQTENWLRDHTVRWKKCVERVSWDELAGLQDTPSELWEVGHRVRNNSVSPAVAEELSCSLYFIAVRDIVLYVCYDGKPQVRGRFTYHNASYDLTVTDPEFEKNVNAVEQVGINECYVTISLAAKPYEKDGRYHKLIAAIITPGHAGEIH